MCGEFRMSSYSGSNGNCVEVAYDKSSYSMSHGNCVETQKSESCPYIHVRDSKNPTGPVLDFTRDEWDAFIKGAKAGEFDL